MQDPREFQEIESMGEQTEEAVEETGSAKRSGGTLVPLLQALLCILALLALVVLKTADREKYEQVTDWYQSEASREIELPSWARERHDASNPPSESSLPPAAVSQKDGILQKI